mmetsp:Transcript_19860/g.56907  ORF Transcript_19860/g.56907 Transcript_19860/m.56907 type:complete len:200 (-) Transcript_19860:1824-2423(-)
MAISPLAVAACASDDHLGRHRTLCAAHRIAKRRGRGTPRRRRRRSRLERLRILLQWEPWLRQAGAANLEPAAIDAIHVLQQLPRQRQRHGRAPRRPQLVLGRPEKERLPRPARLSPLVAGARRDRLPDGRARPAGEVLPVARAGDVRRAGEGSHPDVDGRRVGRRAPVAQREREGLRAEFAHEQGEMDVHVRAPEGAPH